MTLNPVRHLRFSAALLACVTAAGCFGVFEQSRARRTSVATAEHVSGQPLRITTRNGSVEVLAEPQREDVEIEATLTCVGNSQEEAEARLADAQLVVEREADGALLMRPVFRPRARNGDGATIKVRIPDSEGINIETSNGRVTVMGKGDVLSNALSVKTSNGSVTVESIYGGVNLKSSNGTINVRGVMGDAVINTSNGKVNVVDVSGIVHAASSNGTVTVHLTEHQSGPITAHTSNAAVDVTLGATFDGEIVMDTSNARIKVQDDADRITTTDMKKTAGRMVLGAGGDISRIRTSNGTISLRVSGSSVNSTSEDT